MNIVSLFLDLPNYVKYQGIEFELRFIKNRVNDARLVYSIYSNDNEKIQNGFFFNDLLNCRCSFLYLETDISNNDELIEAIENFKLFLTENKEITF